MKRGSKIVCLACATLLAAKNFAHCAVYTETALQQVSQQGTYPPFELTPQAYQLRIDNSGHVMGEIYESNFYDPVVWSPNGVATDLYNPIRNSGFGALGINGISGDVYGENSSGAYLCVVGTNEESITFNKNGMYQISLLSSPFVTSNGLVVHAMNNKGDLIWMNLQMSYAGLITSTGTNKYISITQMPFVNCMNDNLQSVGYSPAVYQYANGAMTTQNSIVLPNGYAASGFNGRWINDSGEVVGSLQNSSGAFEPFEWTATTGLILLNTGTSSSGYADCVNSEGVIVGSVGGEAVEWENGIPVDLNTLLPAGSTNITNAYQITDSGYILASKSNAPFILAPVPEPSTVVIALPFALLLLKRSYNAKPSFKPK